MSEDGRRIMIHNVGATAIILVPAFTVADHRFVLGPMSVGLPTAVQFAYLPAEREAILAEMLETMKDGQ